MIMKMKYMNPKITSLVLLVLFVICSLEAQEIKDYDGNTYKEISYGQQKWLACNLKVSHFRNGDPIMHAETIEEWLKAAQQGIPAWCYPGNDKRNDFKHGKLYNWYAVNDPRGLSPEGWNIPANSDWMQLVKSLNGNDVAGGRLKQPGDWKSGSGTNSIGFSALPSGYRDGSGTFKDFGKSAGWWSVSSPVDVKPTDEKYYVRIKDRSSGVNYLPVARSFGLSVRCVKD